MLRKAEASEADETSAARAFTTASLWVLPSVSTAMVSCTLAAETLTDTFDAGDTAEARETAEVIAAIWEVP